MPENIPDFIGVVPLFLPSLNLLSCEMAVLCQVRISSVTSQNTKVFRKLPREDGRVPDEKGWEVGAGGSGF